MTITTDYLFYIVNKAEIIVHDLIQTKWKDYEHQPIDSILVETMKSDASKALEELNQQLFPYRLVLGIEVSHTADNRFNEIRVILGVLK